MGALLLPSLQVATLQDAINAARSAPRTVGVYVQMANIDFYNGIAIAAGQTLVEDLVLNLLASNGEARSRQQALLQAHTWSSGNRGALLFWSTQHQHADP